MHFCRLNPCWEVFGRLGLTGRKVWRKERSRGRRRFARRSEREVGGGVRGEGVELAMRKKRDVFIMKGEDEP
jgi:hypothetical protein